MHDLIIFILIISALLVVASLLQPLAERLKLPHSVLLAAVGVAIAVTSVTLTQMKGPLVIREAAEAVSGLSFNSSTYILVFCRHCCFRRR